MIKKFVLLCLTAIVMYAKAGEDNVDNPPLNLTDENFLLHTGLRKGSVKGKVLSKF